MRSASTSSPSAMSTMACSAPEVTSASAGKVGHSACQPPSARSCSWTCAAKDGGGEIGRDRRGRRAPPRRRSDCACAAWSRSRRGRARAGSNASPTSVCISSATSRAILPQVPARIAKAAATSASRSRWLCQGASGSGRSSSAASRSATSRPRSPSAASVPAAPPNCSTSASRAQPPQPLARARQRRRIAGELEPERHRQRVLQQRARDRQRCGDGVPASVVKPAIGAVEVGEQRIDRGAQLEHQRGVDDVLAGRAPMHVARRLRVAAWRPRRSAP